MQKSPIFDSQEINGRNVETLVQGRKARVKQTGQIVDLIRVSDHGISMVAFRKGGEYFISNMYLEPVLTLH